MTPHLFFSLFTLLAFVLFAAEVFVPGGILGAIGGASLITACVFAVQAFGVPNGIYVSVFLIFITLVCFVVWLVKLPNSRIGKRFSLNSSLTTAKSATSQPDLVGKSGVAETDLRPSGFIRVDGERLDVVAGRGYIDKGTSVIITEVHGSRIVVRPDSPNTEA